MGYTYSTGNHRRHTGRSVRRGRRITEADVQQAESARQQMYERILRTPDDQLSTLELGAKRSLESIRRTQDRRSLYVTSDICCYSDGEVLPKSQADALIDTGRAVRCGIRESGAVEYDQRAATLEEMQSHQELLRRMRIVMGAEKWVYYSNRLAVAAKAIARLERVEEVMAA